MFTNHTTGVVCPSERVIEKLRDYGVTAPMRIIPTGIEIDKFLRPDITEEMIAGMRQQLGIEEQQIMLLSLSRISYTFNLRVKCQMKKSRFIIKLLTILSAPQRRKHKA